MGKYVNPPDQYKEQWLADNAVKVFDGVPSFTYVDQNHVLVCLFDNLIFTAALVVDDEREYEAATDLSDRRIRTWFLVQREGLNDVV